MSKLDQKENAKRSVRTTVSIPSDQYTEIERIAMEKKVSVAWVVRDAVEQYLGRDTAIGAQK